MYNNLSVLYCVSHVFIFRSSTLNDWQVAGLQDLFYSALADSGLQIAMFVSKVDDSIV